MTNDKKNEAITKALMNMPPYRDATSQSPTVSDDNKKR